MLDADGGAPYEWADHGRPPGLGEGEDRYGGGQQGEHDQDAGSEAVVAPAGGQRRQGVRMAAAYCRWRVTRW